MTQDDLKQQLLDVVDSAWHHGELDKLDELFADDVVIHDAAAGETYEGLEAFKGWVADVREGFPDFEVHGFEGEMSTEDFVVDEHFAASQWIASGTHEGQLPSLDIEPTNRTVEFSGATFYQMEGGKVQEAWWHYDMLDFLQQLGAVPQELTA